LPPHNANDHIRLGEMERFRKAVLGEGIRTICAATFSATASGTPTRRSSTPVAMLGTPSWKNPTSSPQSEPENGHRSRFKAVGMRYPSDVTDEEWELIAPLIPSAKRGGGKRRVDMRAVMNGMMYVLSTGCQWRYIPKDLPPRSTVNRYFCDWSYDGTLDRIHDALYLQCREKLEREASPPACLVDSQS